MGLEFIGKSLLVEKDKKKILVIGDMHLGYEEALNESGIFVVRKMFDEMIKDLDKIFGKIRELSYKSNKEGGGENNDGRKEEGETLVDKVVLLGDVKHEFRGDLRQEWKEVIGLIDYLSEKCKEIIIIRGNHDNYLKNIINRRKNVRINNYFVWNSFCFVHGNRDFEEIWDKKINYLVVGHLHPAIKLTDGIKVEKYKCFLEGYFKNKNIVIVPSFFNYVEGADIGNKENNLVWKIDLNKFKVKVIGENLSVLDFGILGELE